MLTGHTQGESCPPHPDSTESMAQPCFRRQESVTLPSVLSRALLPWLLFTSIQEYAKNKS